MSSRDVVFILFKGDVIACAREMGIPQEAITDEVMYEVTKGIESGLSTWPEVVKTALTEALKD